jgi:hypothetical protein
MPSHQELMAARDAVVAQHPTLRVVVAHLGSLEYDVDEIARRFDQYPNFVVDISARLTDFALQDTDKVRRFCIDYQYRILWGTDLVAGAVSHMPPEKQAHFLNYAEATYREYTEFFERDGDVQIGHHTRTGLVVHQGDVLAANLNIYPYILSCRSSSLPSRDTRRGF